MVEILVFLVAAAIILAGGVGVVVCRNPVHAALSLVATLFGVAVCFVAQEAHFLAAVQVIVYAGAIVVLFLFVIMLLGVDQAEDLRVEPIAGQRPAAVAAGVAVLGLSLVALVIAGGVTGERPVDSRAIEPADAPNITELARVLFTRYVFAFEATAILLTIAVVGAVVLARRATAPGDRPAETTETAETAETAETGT